jgi:hypothetical protein
MRVGVENRRKKNRLGILLTIRRWLLDWLNKETRSSQRYQCNFKRLMADIRPCDVLLVEGHSRASRIIKALSHSQWTHSAIYIGRFKDIEDPALRKRVLAFYPARPNDRLLVEPLLGKGTVITPLKRYRYENYRVCRPSGLSAKDAQKVLAHVINHVGLAYHVRQMVEMAFYSLSFNMLPRRWLASLYTRQEGIPDRTLCSTMIASAFALVNYPIQPIVRYENDGRVHLYHRNSLIYVPKDFDTSPYFDTLKFPHPVLDNPTLYNKLPWDDKGIVCNSENECFLPTASIVQGNQGEGIAVLLFRMVSSLLAIFIYAVKFPVRLLRIPVAANGNDRPG